MTKDYKGFAVYPVTRKNRSLNWLRKLPKTVKAILGLIALIPAAWYLFLYIEGLPDFDVSLKQVSLFRSDDNSVPSALFNFQIENHSTSQYTVSVDSILFSYFKLTYKFKANNSKNAIPGRTPKNILVSESDLFFDILLSLPFTSETTSLEVFYSYENTHRTLLYDDDNVVKCLFIQFPRIEPRGYYDKLRKVRVSVPTSDTTFDVNVYFSPQTLPFIKLVPQKSLTRLGSYYMLLDQEIFEPIYAGIYFFNVVGSGFVFQQITPEQAFGKVSEYNISKLVKKKIEFDFKNTVEFVTIIFDEIVDKDLYHDNKIIPIQIIATADTANPAALKLKELLLNSGFRVEIKKTNLSYILNEIAPKSLDGEPYVRKFKDNIIEHYVEINTILSKDGIIVIDFDRDPPEFTRQFMKELSESGYEQLAMISIPTKGFRGGTEGRYFEDIARIFLYRTVDTVFYETWIDSLTGEEMGALRIVDKYAIRGR